MNSNKKYDPEKHLATMREALKLSQDKSLPATLRMKFRFAAKRHRALAKYAKAMAEEMHKPPTDSPKSTPLASEGNTSSSKTVKRPKTWKDWEEADRRFDAQDEGWSKEKLEEALQALRDAPD